MTPRSVNGSQRPHPGGELPFAAVDQDQRGKRGEAGVAFAVVRREVGLFEVAGHPPRQHLLHRGEVVGAAVAGAALAQVAADFEAAVVGLLRRPALEDDHRGDGVLAADRRDVEALDPDRQLLHPQRLGAAPPAPRPGARAGARAAAGPDRGPAGRCARPARAAAVCRRARRRGPRPGRRGARSAPRPGPRRGRAGRGRR